MDNVKKFFSDLRRDIYLSFGIPYKSVQLFTVLLEQVKLVLLNR